MARGTRDPARLGTLTTTRDGSIMKKLYLSLIALIVVVGRQHGRQRYSVGDDYVYWPN